MSADNERDERRELDALERDHADEVRADREAARDDGLEPWQRVTDETARWSR